MKARLYTACVRSCLLYGSETWVVTKENQRKLESTENRMIRKMYNGKGRGGVSGDMLRQEMGIMKITEYVRMGRLRWFGHIRRKEESSWVRRCMGVEIEGRTPKGRPKMTWMQVVRRDMEMLGMEEVEAEDRDYWRFRLYEVPANLGRLRPSWSLHRFAFKWPMRCAVKR